MTKSVRITKRSYEQANELKDAGWQSLTNVVSVAIDRMHRAERPKEAEMEVARHKSGNGTVVLKERDHQYLVTVHKEAMPPHYSKLHDTYREAAVDFERLAKGKTTGWTRDDICVEINAGSWVEVQRAFSDMSAEEVEAKLDEMFPNDDNREIAEAIVSKLD